MARRISTPGQKLKFLPDKAFEDETALLLAEYSNKHGQVTGPPIPIDEIVELYLGLNLEFLDMQGLFGVDDVHGALWVNDRKVGIDQRLDPSENPSKLGRFRFTLAHEAGHWRLHRHLFLHRASQQNLLPDSAPRPEYICRSSDKSPMEYQADRFASCLLMPKEMVKRAWHEWRGDMTPMYLADVRAEANRDITDELVLENAIRPFAAIFQVSCEAMRIRSEGMGFLMRAREPSLFD
jgi:hypothetical protein